jgi:hypothetical protein
MRMRTTGKNIATSYQLVDRDAIQDAAAVGTTKLVIAKGMRSLNESSALFSTRKCGRNSRNLGARSVLSLSHGRNHMSTSMARTGAGVIRTAMRSSWPKTKSLDGLLTKAWVRKRYNCDDEARGHDPRKHREGSEEVGSEGLAPRTQEWPCRRTNGALSGDGYLSVKIDPRRPPRPELMPQSSGLKLSMPS